MGISVIDVIVDKDVAVIVVVSGAVLGIALRIGCF